VRVELCACGTVCVWNCVHVELYACGTVYMRNCVRVELGKDRNSGCGFPTIGCRGRYLGPREC
jgi:hypothetical protein